MKANFPIYNLPEIVVRFYVGFRSLCRILTYWVIVQRLQVPLELGIPGIIERER